MPKIKWANVNGEDVDAIDPDENDFTPYDGPVPPKGVYLCDVKKMTYEKFSSGNKGFTVLLIINDPNKERYEGAPMWERLVDSEGSAFRIRQFLDAIGGSGKDWDNILIDNENAVTKVGRFPVSGMQVKVATRVGANQNGDPRAEVARWLPKGEGSGNGKSTGSKRSGRARTDDDDPAPF